MPFPSRFPLRGSSDGDQILCLGSTYWGGGSCPDTGTCKGIIKGTHAHRADHNDKVTTSKYVFRTHGIGIQVSVILDLSLV